MKKMNRLQLIKLIREEMALSIETGDAGVYHTSTTGRHMGSGGEAGMARGQLFTVAQQAQSLHDRLTDEDELPEWVQSKITKIHDYMGTVDDYLSYKMHRHDSGDPIPESRRQELQQIVREATGDEEALVRPAGGDGATAGEQAKGGGVIDKLKQKLDKVPGLAAIMKKIDTKAELQDLMNVILTSAIETGGVSQAEVETALRNALSAAKKG